MQWGVSTYALAWSIGVPGYEPPRHPLDIYGFLHKVNNAGVHLVQIADNIPLHLMQKGELEQLKKIVDELALTVEVGTRGTEPEHLMKYLDIAKFFNSGLVRTIIPSTDMVQAEKDIHQVVDKFSEAGTSLAIENHGLQLTSQLIELFHNIGSPYVGSCLDTVNSFSALQCPDRVIQDLSPYLINLHVKDFDIQRVSHQMGFEVLGTPIGRGRLNVKEILTRLKAMGKDPSVIIELWPPYTNSVEETIALEEQWFYESVEYMKQF